MRQRNVFDNNHLEQGFQQMDSQFAKTAAVATLVSLLADEYHFPSIPIRDKYEPIRGRIIGGDNGKGRKVQPRNAPCQCGSGRKAKRCCVFIPQEPEGNTHEAPESDSLR